MFQARQRKWVIVKIAVGGGTTLKTIQCSLQRDGADEVGIIKKRTHCFRLMHEPI